MSEKTKHVLDEVAVERVRQTMKHGDQRHLPDGTGPYVLGDLHAGEIHMKGDGTLNATIGRRLRRYAVGVAAWAKARTDASHEAGTKTFEQILTEEWAEAMAESDPVALRAELIQVAAVAVQWVEAIDHRAEVSP